MTRTEAFDSELKNLIALFPDRIQEFIYSSTLSNLIEIVFDCYRPIELRYTDHTEKSDFVVYPRDLAFVLKSPMLSDFNHKNRAGVEGTLHRISAIRATDDEVIGLTCRVGRVVGSAYKLIEDEINSDDSTLLLGRPGVGKSTLLREICAVLSRTKRVVIVDSSNEIAGDGIYPHIAVGNSRRLMIPRGKKLAEVMIEACENHTPEVIVIDEISNYAEAQAARSIAERGVRLIASAHGVTLPNLMNNPQLLDLVGKPTAQTMSDTFFRKSGTKNKLDREHSAVFNKLVEIIDFNTVAIHQNVEESVDYLINGKLVRPEIRTLDSQKRVIIKQDYSVEEDI